MTDKQTTAQITRRIGGPAERTDERRTKMLNRIASKAARIARGTALTLGATVVLALILGVATTALAGTGVGATFNLGKVNSVNAVSKLVGNVAGAMLVVDNNGSGSALDLQVGPSTTAPADKTVAPLKVDSQAKVANLNADELDGKDASEFAPAAGFGASEVIDTMGRLPVERPFVSKGGTILISVSGSGFRGSGAAQGAGLIGMEVKVDGVKQDHSLIYTNERDSHKAFVNDHIVVGGLPAGSHTIRLEAMYDSSNCNTPNESIVHVCTSTDSYDSFTASITELPS